MESSKKKKNQPVNKDKSQSQPLIKGNTLSKSKTVPLSNLGSTINTNTFLQLSSMYSQNQQELPNPSSSSDYSSIFLTKFDTEVQRILHSLSKRSEVTKLKALLELQEILKSRDESFLESFLPTWTYLYKEILTCEFDKKLLEEANQIIMIYVNQGKTCLKGQFKEIFPYWFLSMNDPNNEVANIAQKSFDTLFPTEKRAQVLSVCTDGFLSNMGFFLKLDLNQILSENNSLNESQAFEILDRLTIAAAHSLSESLLWIKGSPKESEYILLFTKTLDLDKVTVGLIKILEILENKKRGLRSRAALLDLLADIYVQLDPEKDFPHQAFHITKAVFSLIDDKERILQQALWRKTLNNILRKTSETIWKKICEGKHRDVLINRIYECLKKAGQGIGAVFYENLTLFLSLLPFAKLKGENNEEGFKWKIGFIKGYMEAIWMGILHEEVKFFSENLVSSYFECLYYLNLKRFSDISSLNLAESTQKFVKKILKNFIKIPLSDFLKNYTPSQALNAYKSIPRRISEFFENISSSIISEGDIYNENLIEYFTEVKESQILFKNPISSENFCLLIRELLMILRRNPHKQLKSLIEGLVNETYIESIDNMRQGFNEKLTDSSIESMLCNMRVYLLVAIEIKAFYMEFSKESLEKLNIAESYAIIAKVMDIILNELANIYKIGNVEKLALRFSRIFRVLQEIAHTIYIKNNEQNSNIELIPMEPLEKLEQNSQIQDILESIPLKLIEKLEELPKLPLLYSQNLLIFVTMILDPLSPESLFNDFLVLEQSPAQQDAFIWRILESSKSATAKPSTVFPLIKASKAYQALIIKFIDLFFSLKKYAMGLIQIPCLLITLRDSLDSSNFNAIIMKTNENCMELLSTNKHESFEKLKNIYILWSFVLIEETMDIDIKKSIIAALYRNFFKTIFKGYYLKNNKDFLDHFYDLLGIIEKKAIIFQEIIILAFEEFNELLQETLKNPLNLTEKTIEALCDFLDFLKSHHRNNEILSFFHEILLKPAMFKEALASRTIWLILKGCLEIITDYKSIEEIFSYKDLVLYEPWLNSLLLSAPNTYALFKDLPLKKFYQEVLRPELLLVIQEFISKDIENNNKKLIIPIVTQLIKDSEEKSLIYLNGLRYFLKSLMKTDDILPLLSEYIIKGLDSDMLKLDNTKVLLRKSLISKTILIQLKGGIMFNDIIENTMTHLKSILHSETPANLFQETDEDLRFLINLDFLLTMQPYHPQIALFLDEELIIRSLESIFKRFTQERIVIFSHISRNFIYGTLFEYYNLIIEQKTFVILSDHIPAIEALFKGCIDYNRTPQRYYTRSLISCNGFLRKILGFLEGFTPEFKAFISKDLLGFLCTRLDRLKDELDEEVMIDESNDLMVVEFAETISRFAIILSKDIEEKVLYELIITPFPAIQKSAFALLKIHYQSIKPSSFVLDEDCDCIKEFGKVFQEISISFFEKGNIFIQECDDEHLIAPITYSYLLVWVTMILKITTTITPAADLENMKKLLKDYFELKPHLYHQFLNNCFKGLKILDPGLTGLENVGSKGNLISSELMKIEVEWSEFLSRDSLLRLIIQSLYLFSLTFPSFLRRWADTADKKYMKTADFYLKGYISPALFLSEIETIEMRQQGNI